MTLSKILKSPAPILLYIIDVFRYFLLIFHALSISKRVGGVDPVPVSSLLFLSWLFQSLVPVVLGSFPFQMNPRET